MNQVFLFDGDCAFCTKLANKLQSKLLDSQIEFQSFRLLSDAQLKKLHPRLTKDLCQGNIQYIYKGKRYPGFFAFRKVSHSLSVIRYFSFLMYLPLVPLLGIWMISVLKKMRN